jgi:hypothetical protein
MPATTVECELCDLKVATEESIVCPVCGAVVGPCCVSETKDKEGKMICAECDEEINREVEIEEGDDNGEDEDDDDDLDDDDLDDGDDGDDDDDDGDDDDGGDDE